MLLRSGGDALVADVRELWRTDLTARRLLFYFDPGGLSDLRDEQDFQHGAPGFFLGSEQDLLAKLEPGKGSVGRLAVIDMMHVMAQIIVGIEDVREVPWIDAANEIFAWSQAT